METSPNITKLANFLKSHPQVKAAILFGSSVTGNFNQDSDFDIAIITERSFSSEAFLDLYLELSSRSPRKVDLIKIDENTSMLLKNEIARKGELLFSKDEALSDEFFIRAPQEYEDLMYWRAPLEKAYIERCLKGS